MIDPIGGGWDFLGIKAPHLLAGALGGLVRVLSRPEEGITRKIFTTMVGAIVAGYATSPVTGIALNYLSAYHLDEASIAGSVGFLLGLTGLSICEGIIRIAQRWRDRGEL